MTGSTPSVSSDFRPPLVALAPMAGVTDLPFRRQAQGFGASYCVSEMVASDQLALARPDVVRRAAGAGVMAPLVIQLAGREPHWLARGAALAEAAGADVIDINMGCPAKMVTSGASGSALMRDPERAEDLIAATVSATKRPVTLKIRLGWNDEERNGVEIARRAERAGVKMLTVHGRTRCQFYTGRADWAAIGEIARAVSIPVIANGDINDAASARAAMKLSGACGVMVGRGAQGRPWLAPALECALRTGGEIVKPDRETILSSLLRLHADSLDFYGPALGLKVARKHIAWSIVAELGDAPDIRAVRQRLCTETDIMKIADGLRLLFETRGALREAA